MHVGEPEERKQLGIFSVDGTIILKWKQELGCEGID
jgi:hypothetical protein